MRTPAGPHQVAGDAAVVKRACIYSSFAHVPLNSCFSSTTLLSAEGELFGAHVVGPVSTV